MADPRYTGGNDTFVVNGESVDPFTYKYGDDPDAYDHLSGWEKGSLHYAMVVDSVLLGSRFGDGWGNAMVNDDISNFLTSIPTDIINALAKVLHSGFGIVMGSPMYALLSLINNEMKTIDPLLSAPLTRSPHPWVLFSEPFVPLTPNPFAWSLVLTTADNMSRLPDTWNSTFNVSYLTRTPEVWTYVLAVP
jgi:hypothetical protein